jgi:subtilisin family serine protease
MERYKVIVPKLNVRKAPVADFNDKSNIITTVSEGLVLDLTEVFDVPNPSLGKWYSDGKGQVYSGLGLQSLESSLKIKDQLFDVSKYWWLNDFKINELWNKGLTGKGIKIAVLDTGVSLPHPDLNINPFTNCSDITDSETHYQDIDKDSHGTHCTGIIKSSNNGFGITGVAYDSDVFICKVSKDVDIKSGQVDDDISYLEMGIKWAIEKDVDIISISKGFYNVYKNIQPIIKDAFEKKNILFVCAGGNNDNSKTYSEIFYPALYDECLSVGAIDQNKKISPTSIVSTHLKLAAPGIDILSTSSNSGYKKLSGSSQATPFVAGIAALTMQYLKQQGKKYNAKGIYKLIIDASDSVKDSNYKIINPINIFKLIDSGKETFI